MAGIQNLSGEEAIRRYKAWQPSSDPNAQAFAVDLIAQLDRQVVTCCEILERGSALGESDRFIMPTEEIHRLRQEIASKKS